jgi:AGCS family alanine or glycine:cation symporter
MIFEALGFFNQYIGGYLLLILLIPAGIIFSFAFGFVQIRHLKHVVEIVQGKHDRATHKGEISHFRALTTALSGTVGTGNIVGVALAIFIGGPGALFWMWLTGFFGMATKFVECTLSHEYRGQTAFGQSYGGPMLYIQQGLKPYIGRGATVLAMVFTIAALFTAVADAMTQMNSMSEGLKDNYAIAPWITGLIFSLMLYCIVIGGIRRIGAVTSRILPSIALLYCICALSILGSHIGEIPAAFGLIFEGAFSGTGATGGFVGSAFMVTAMKGVQRGLFSNEAGAGSAAMAHAAAKTDEPIREGLVASIGPLIDTLFICTMTGLTIIVTGAWKSGIEGVGMTIEAFKNAGDIPWVGALNLHIVPIALLFFAFTTIIAYAYYGETAYNYLIRSKPKDHFLQRQGRTIYFLIICITAFLGTQLSVSKVWDFMDAAYSMMAIPNLIALLVLFPKVRKKYIQYKQTYLTKPTQGNNS